MSSSIPHISLFYYQQNHTAIFIFFSCTMNYTFQRVFSHCTFPVSIFFNQSLLKADAVHQMIHPCSLKKSTIGQLNVQAATAVQKN